MLSHGRAQLKGNRRNDPSLTSAVHSEGLGTLSGGKHKSSAVLQLNPTPDVAWVFQGLESICAMSQVWVKSELRAWVSRASRAQTQGLRPELGLG